MTLSVRVATHLPFLRRFSRALSGNQASGDAYVVALLEAIIADPIKVENIPNLKTELYRQFCELWDAGALTLHDGHYPNFVEEATQRQLLNVGSDARKAFLLMAVEDFAVDDISHVLGKTEQEVEALLQEATQTIVSHVATDIMIIEDEPIIAMDLEAIMESLGHRVVGVARTEKEAITLALKTKPRLVLADVQLADGSSGIDAVDKILSSANLPVIFITAYPERLLTGEKPEPAFLITKPFLPNMVKAVVSQALFFKDTSVQFS